MVLRKSGRAKTRPARPLATAMDLAISTRSFSESESCLPGKMDEKHSLSKILAAVGYPRRGLSPFGLRLLDAVVALRSYIVD